MIFYGVLFIIVGIFIIIFPALLAYIVAGFIIFIGLNLLFIGLAFKNAKKKFQNEVVFQIGSYKILKK